METSLIPWESEELSLPSPIRISDSFEDWVKQRLMEVFFTPLQRSGWSVGGLAAAPPNGNGQPVFSIQVFEPRRVIGVTTGMRQSAKEVMRDAELILFVDLRRSWFEAFGAPEFKKNFKYVRESIALRAGEDPAPLVLGFLRQFQRAKLTDGSERLPERQKTIGS